MRIMNIRARAVATAMIASALTIAGAACPRAFAASQQLDCILTDTPARPHSESRTVSVAFDEDNNTLAAEADGRHYNFSEVTITYIAISGHAGDISLGIDRSSLGIVWQQYGNDKVNTEYGHCRPTGAPG